jgi:hypothetical protein
MNATQFLNTISSQVNDWDLAQVQSLAQNAGYHFSSEDLATAADELWGNLSEDQLRDIAGGGGNGRQDPGPVDIDKSRMDGKKEGEVWSPPPGEVSGRSCFFIRG